MTFGFYLAQEPQVSAVCEVVDIGSNRRIAPPARHNEGGNLTNYSCFAAQALLGRRAYFSAKLVIVCLSNHYKVSVVNKDFLWSKSFVFESYARHHPHVGDGMNACHRNFSAPDLVNVLPVRLSDV
ncbi:MAG: hypothetical protein DDT38_00910 [Firmicutes bacterium]|nr:hypothetical protein [candidate division NPL-UPA2 bacterium]